MEYGRDPYKLPLPPVFPAAADDTEDYWRRLAVHCNGLQEDEVGKWEAIAVTGDTGLSTALVENNNKIVEQECAEECGDLALSHVHDDWTDLVCDTPLEAGTEADEGKLILKDGNACVLLCDNHLSKVIECKFEANGEKWWVNTRQDPFEWTKSLTDNDIRC